MKRLPTILLLFILSGCNFFMSAEDYRKEANKLEQQGQYKAAILLLNKAIEKEPENIYALLDRGADRSMLKDYRGACIDYSKVAELDTFNTLAFFNRALNKKRLEDYNGAIADINKAIATKGGEVLYVNRVKNPLVDTRYEFDVNMEELRFERGISYYHIDSLKKAFDDFSFSITKEYSLSESYYWRGAVFLRVGNTEQACFDLNRAKSLGNTDVQGLIDEYCK